MIEAIMYSAIGFLTATLLALLALPAVWRRAVRLTRKRIEGAIPGSVAEILADKDEQRAIFAVDVRRLELEVEKLQARAAAQWGEVNDQADELRARQSTIERLTGELDTIQVEHVEVVGERDRLAGALDTRTRDLDETRQTLKATKAELRTTREALEDTTAREEELKIDHVALTTLRDTLKDRIGELDRHLSAANAQLTTARDSLRSTSDSLSSELARTRELTHRLADTETRLARIEAEASALATERAALTARAAELEVRTQAAEQARHATEAEANRVTAEAHEGRRAAEAQARSFADTIEMLRAEKAMLDDAIAKAREDRAALQRRLDTSGPLAAGSPGDEDGTALLRQRIGDIAAEVAHLTARLEGPGSPIDALLAGHAPAANGAAPSLADRILALRGTEPAANHAAE
ncbi:hypothetical protein MWN33_16675 [Starkeya koreensis]|uniref:Uncharacterized protein n=1 Tax=Ancylobacter koreensis TaxID=266121 RepID=A0ABT0DQV7_9HYPH|nr:hypothetical protein [Ancylobacter koreensis]MCK0209669.1 hypothetical protein [Ancylobacter koreensis]